MVYIVVVVLVVLLGLSVWLFLCAFEDLERSRRSQEHTEACLERERRFRESIEAKLDATEHKLFALRAAVLGMSKTAAEICTTAREALEQGTAWETGHDRGV